MAEAPRITVYARILDNKDENVLRGYEDAYKNNVWFFGQMSGMNSSESPYVMEFDIWNNEPALNGLQSISVVSDATNCRLTAWDNEEKKTVDNIRHFNGTDYINFVHARCVTHDFTKSFVPIGGTREYSEIFGNALDNTKPESKGVLSGRGDRTKIQAKIILPSRSDQGTTTIVSGERKFVFAFHYDFE